MTTALAETAQPPTRADFEKIEAAMLRCEPGDHGTRHHFADGVYVRECVIGAGVIALGHEHKTAHFNFVLEGEGELLYQGTVQHVKAPCFFIAEPGVRKLLRVRKAMRWFNVHPNPAEQREVNEIETRLIQRSDTFNEFTKTMTAAEVQRHMEGKPLAPQEIST